MNKQKITMATFLLVFILMTMSCMAAKDTNDDIWSENFEEVLRESKISNKPILINFTGSDWCRWCIILHKEVFDQPAFIDYAKNDLILFKADFPRRIKQSDELKKQNQELLEKYQIQGFPTILLIDHELNVIGRTGYREGGEIQYIEHLKEYITNWRTK